jgi:hypothetical protein
MPEEVRADARRSLHPTDGGIEQRGIAPVLEELPIDMRPVIGTHNGSLDQLCWPGSG